MLLEPAFDGAYMDSLVADTSFKGWTDQYSSLWPILSLGRLGLSAQ